MVYLWTVFEYETWIYCEIWINNALDSVKETLDSNWTA